MIKPLRLIAKLLLFFSFLLLVFTPVFAEDKEIPALSSRNTLFRSFMEDLEKTRRATNNTNKYTVRYVTKEASTYQEPVNATVDSSFFDWLCHSLSRLFN